MTIATLQGGEMMEEHLNTFESLGRRSSNDVSGLSRIPRIAVVGTGLVGSTTAYPLMMSGMAAEIVLINRNRRRAVGHTNGQGFHLGRSA